MLRRPRCQHCTRLVSHHVESYGRVSCLLALPVMTTIAAAARQGAAYVLGVPHHSLFAAPTDADVANVHAPTRMQMFHHPTGCDGHSTCLTISFMYFYWGFPFLLFCYCLFFSCYWSSWSRMQVDRCRPACVLTHHSSSLRGANCVLPSGVLASQSFVDCVSIGRTYLLLWVKNRPSDRNCITALIWGSFWTGWPATHNLYRSLVLYSPLISCVFSATVKADFE